MHSEGDQKNPCSGEGRQQIDSETAIGCLRVFVCSRRPGEWPVGNGLKVSGARESIRERERERDLKMFEIVILKPYKET